MKDLQEQATADIVIALVGNQIDLCNTMRCVQTYEVQTYANEHRLRFTETSTKTSVNITEIFREIGTYKRINN